MRNNNFKNDSITITDRQWLNALFHSSRDEEKESAWEDIGYVRKDRKDGTRKICRS